MTLTSRNLTLKNENTTIENFIQTEKYTINLTLYVFHQKYAQLVTYETAAVMTELATECLEIQTASSVLWYQNLNIVGRTRKQKANLSCHVFKPFCLTEEASCLKIQLLRCFLHQ